MPHERVTEDIIEGLESLTAHLRATDPNQKMYVSQKIWADVPLEEEHAVDFERLPSVMELLEFIAHRPIKDQAYMLCNLLTISGFTQGEIAEALGISHISYRKALMEVRRDFRGRT